MVLDGLEGAVRCAVPRRCRINFDRYADGFIITGKSKSILEDAIRPVERIDEGVHNIVCWPSGESHED